MNNSFKIIRNCKRFVVLSWYEGFSYKYIKKYLPIYLELSGILRNFVSVMVKKVKNMAFSHNSLIINRLRVTHCKSISYTISYKYINNYLEIWNILRIFTL